MFKKFSLGCAAVLFAATVAFASHPSWKSQEVEKFSNMLYEAALSDGNWDNHLEPPGIKMMTNCIAKYYSERISFQKALEYYDTMPPDVNQEFQIVLYQCFQFVKENENNYI